MSKSSKEEEDDKTQLKVGARVSCEGFTGTLRYIGPILHEQSGIDKNEVWVGIEWDDPSRGKHQGTVKDIKYFDCLNNGSGSLLKPEKLEYGRSLLVCLTEKYATNYKDIKKEEDDLFFVDSKTLYTKKVEMVGMDKVGAKQSRLDVLQQISLIGESVASVDSNLGETCPNLNDVDLTRNLLCDWNEVASLGRQLKKLTFLTLSGNRFAPITKAPNFIDFPMLKVLVLNNCKISWDQIALLESSFPALEELHICNNNISTFSKEDYVIGFENLTTLNIDGNNVSSWDEVLKFSRLPKLEKILVNENKLESVFLRGSPTECFVNLKSLSLTHNLINSWDTINALNNFDKLDILRFYSNPLTAPLGPSISRQLLIARIGKLQMFNGSPVRRQERIDSEKYYLKVCINSGTSDHPRYQELIEEYGVPQLEKKESETIADEMINVTISSMVGNAATIQKKVPATLLVSNLKILCNRLFQVDPTEQKLFVKASKESPFVEPLDDDTRPLSYYGVSESSEIIVEGK